MSSLAPASLHGRVPIVRMLQVFAAVVLIVFAFGVAGTVSSVLLGQAPESLSTYVPSGVSAACAEYVGVQAGERGGGLATTAQCEEPLPR